MNRFVILALLLFCSSPAFSSDFPPDPIGAKILDRVGYFDDHPFLYAIMYDEYGDRLIEIYQAYDRNIPDYGIETAWKSIFKTVYRNEMDHDFLNEFPFELLMVSEHEDKIFFSAVGRLETEAGILIYYDKKTGIADIDYSYWEEH